MSWKSSENILIYEIKLSGINQIASFDFDNTLVKSKTRKMIKDVDDLTLFDDKVKRKLEKLKKKYQLVIFSNQKGISKNRVSEEEIKNRFEKLFELLGFPIFTVIAKKGDEYRKPFPKMIELLGFDVDLKNSFYCGDAAGRHKDFACSDREFAHNVGIPFYTPENLFLKQEEKVFSYKSYEFESKKLEIKVQEKEKEMILLVGSPASGKSYFSEKINYVRINRDTLKTKAKCLKTAKLKMIDNKSIIIDNTNPDKKTRKEYIDLAKKYNYVIKCYFFDYPFELSRHLNFVRIYQTGKSVPEIALRIYYKKLEKPELSEGFTEIITLDFVPNFEEKPEFFYKLS